MKLDNSQAVRVVVGILRKENKILVAQRPLHKSYSGYWEFPGGKIEANETSEAALKRELYEELGVEMIVAQFCFQHQHAYPDKIVLLDIWLVTEFSPKPYGKENQTLYWASFPELLKLKLLEGNWAIMEKIKTLV